MYKIVTTPNHILTDIAQPVKSFDKKLKKILQEMEVTLIHTSDPVGVGLAAPQVGLSLRIFLARPTEKESILHFINPVIESIEQGDTTNKASKKSQEEKKLLEGCLSIPTIWGHVSRAQKVTLSYQNAKGKLFKKTYTGFMATIIQHEMDHLNGVLFTSHVLTQGEILYKSSKNENGEEVFEEIHL